MTMANVLAKTAERAAQAVYDLRDCIPASDGQTWLYLDEVARNLSEYGAGLRASPETSATATQQVIPAMQVIQPRQPKETP